MTKKISEMLPDAEAARFGEIVTSINDAMDKYDLIPIDQGVTFNKAMHSKLWAAMSVVDNAGTSIANSQIVTNDSIVASESITAAPGISGTIGNRRVTAIATSQVDDSKIWVATEDKKLFKSLDYGITWTEIADFNTQIPQPGLLISQVVMSQTGQARLWVVFTDGNAYTVGSGIRETKILQTNNADAATPSFAPALQSTLFTITKLVASPTNDQELVAAVNNTTGTYELLRSTDAGGTFLPTTNPTMPLPILDLKYSQSGNEVCAVSSQPVAVGDGQYVKLSNTAGATWADYTRNAAEGNRRIRGVIPYNDGVDNRWVIIYQSPESSSFRAELITDLSYTGQSGNGWRTGLTNVSMSYDYGLGNGPGRDAELVWCGNNNGNNMLVFTDTEAFISNDNGSTWSQIDLFRGGDLYNDLLPLDGAISERSSIIGVNSTNTTVIMPREMITDTSFYALQVQGPYSDFFKIPGTGIPGEKIIVDSQIDNA